MKLLYSRFLGEIPLLEPTLLPANNAVTAFNIKNERGNLETLRDTANYRQARKPNDQLSIYRFAPTPGSSSSGWMFSWQEVVDCVPGPVAGNVQHLTYWTGEDYPRYTDNSIATSETGPLPAASYRLGVEAPEFAPVGVLIYETPVEPFTPPTTTPTTTPPTTTPPTTPPTPTTDTGGDSGGGTMPDPDDASTDVDRDYVVTFMQQLGSLEMEGPPSEPSNIITVPSSPAGFGVQLNNLPTPPSGPYPWGNKRIYRRIYSAGRTQFALVATVANDLTEYRDLLPDAEIPGDILTSDNYDPPPEDLHSLGSLSNGIMYGAVNNDVCISEPYLPHAWSVFSRYPLPYDIVGMGHVDNRIVAVTARNPYMVVGINPGAMNTIEVDMDQGCLSKRSVLSGSFGCVFASPDGMILISAQGSQNITQSLMTREQWQALNPSSMISATNEGLLIVTFRREDDTSGSFIMDPANIDAGIRFTDKTFTAHYHDGLLDSLLVYDPDKDQICLWDEGDPMPYRWRSKLHMLPVPACFTAARVEAVSYANLVFRLFVDGDQVHEQRLTDNRSFRLPSGYQSRSVQVEIAGLDAVKSICIAEAPHELE